jgi:hypothetical protein
MADTQNVRVCKFGSDEKTLDFVEGGTIGDYLRRAEVTVDEDQVITFNGEDANSETPVEPGAVIVVEAKVANG